MRSFSTVQANGRSREPRRVTCSIFIYASSNTHLQLALANTPNLRLRVVRLLIYRGTLRNRFLPVLNIQSLILLHSGNRFALDAPEELLVSRDIVNESDDLASGPDLLQSACEHVNGDDGTYTKVWVTVQEHLTTSLSTDVFCNFLELACLALLLDVNGLERNFVGEQSRGVLPPPKDKRGVCFLRVDDGLLDVVVYGRLDSAHESSAHVDTTGAERKGSSQTLTICETSGCDEWYAKRLPRLAQQDEVCDIRLPNVSSAFEAID
jgi:hypothetical protein